MSDGANVALLLLNRI